MASCVTVRFAPERRREFDLLHSAANDAGWCRCVAWWHPTWEGFGESTADENRSVREELCARGEYDGHLLLDGGLLVAPASRRQGAATQLVADVLADLPRRAHGGSRPSRAAGRISSLAIYGPARPPCPCSNVDTMSPA